jgi:tetratricopeptide (TPR) repeat protein
MLYLRNKQFGGAAAAFLIETQMRPKSAEASVKLATAYSYWGKSQDALKEFERAQKLDPNNPDIYMGLAFLNNTSERYQYAVQYLNEYIKRAPQPGPGYALLSRVYLNMRLYEKAVEAGQKATEAMPENGNVWYNLGQAYSYRPGEQFLPQAAQAFERALQTMPDFGPGHFELGRVYSRQRRFPDAISQYREAVRCEPKQGKYHYQLGQLLKQQGEPEESQKALREAQTLLPLNQRESQLMDQITASPKDPRPLFEMGEVSMKLGYYDRAQSYFSDALRLNPRYPQARERLSEARRLATGSPSQ